MGEEKLGEEKIKYNYKYNINMKNEPVAIRRERWEEGTLNSLEGRDATWA